MLLLKLLQQTQRPLVVGAGTYLTIEAWNIFQVVVKHVRWIIAEDLQGAIHSATEVRHQGFDADLRALGADRTDAIGEVLRTAVTQIVAVDGGDHHVA